MKLRTSLMILLVMGLLVMIPCVAASPVNQPEWGAWGNLGQVQTTGDPRIFNASPGVVARMPNQLDVYVFDTSSSDSNWQLKDNWWNGFGWQSSWTPITNTSYKGINPVTATAMTSTRVDVFANANHNLYQTWNSPSSWSTWSKPNGVDFVINDMGPSAVSPTSTTQYVFWVSPLPEGHLRYIYWNGTSWQYTTATGNGYDLLPPSGLTIMSSPAAVKNPDTGAYASDVWVFVMASDNKLWFGKHYLNPSSGQYIWSAWQQVPGSFNDLAGAPAAVSRYPGCVDVVYRTDAGKIVLREWTTAGGWSGETILDQWGTVSDPSIASWDQARLDVFVEFPAGDIWHTNWSSPKPQITSVSPSSIMAGSINTTITIIGNNFYPNSEVRQHPSGTPLLTTTFVDEHTLTAVVPTAWLTTPGSFPIYVNVPGTTQSNFLSADYTITVTAKNNLPMDKIGVTNGQHWYLDSNGNGAWDSGIDTMNTFGSPGWTQVTGDWTGNGTTKIGIYKEGTWYLDMNGNGVWDGTTTDRLVTAFGLPGWTPVMGDWTGNGITKIGIYKDGTWYLDMNGNGAWDGMTTDRLVTSFGMPDWTQIVGKWS